MSFDTTELPLAAYLKSGGHVRYTIRPGDSPHDFVTFAFEGDSQDIAEEAKTFLNGGQVEALAFYNTLLGLRAEIRMVRGGAR